MADTIRAYKGFDSDLRCRGFQFAVGESYEEKTASLCESGFHACENPMDVLTYYPPCGSRYCEVELSGVTDQKQGDTKRAATGIRIVRELTRKEFFAACHDYLAALELTQQASGDRGHAQASGDSGHAQASGDSGHAQVSGDSGHAQVSGDSGHAQASGDRGHAQASGDRGHAQASGYRGHAQASGYSGHAQASGYSGHAQASGKHSVACSLGIYGRATASGDCRHIVLAEHDDDLNLIAVRVGEVGKEIESGKTYQLKCGEFVVT